MLNLKEFIYWRLKAQASSNHFLELEMFPKTIYIITMSEENTLNNYLQTYTKFKYHS